MTEQPTTPCARCRCLVEEVVPDRQGRLVCLRCAFELQATADAHRWESARRRGESAREKALREARDWRLGQEAWRSGIKRRGPGKRPQKRR